MGVSLQAAAGKNDVVILQRLLDAGAEVNVEAGWSPLMRAAQSGHVKASKFLLAAGAKLETKTRNKTAADIALENGHEELAEVLGGARPINDIEDEAEIEKTEKIEKKVEQSTMSKEDFIAKWGPIEKLSIQPMELKDPDGNLIMKGTLYNVGYFKQGEDPENMDLNWSAIDKARTFLDPAMKLLNEAGCMMTHTESEAKYHPFFMKIDEGFPLPDDFDAFVSEATREKGRGAYSNEIEVVEGSALFEDLDDNLSDEFITEKEFQAYKKVNALTNEMDIGEAWEYRFYPDFVDFPVIRGGIDAHDNFVGYISSKVWT